MRIRVLAVLGGSLFLLSACVTAPTTGSIGQHAGGSLKTCDGRVSNVPSVNRDGEVQKYSPTLVVRGQQLLRAPVHGCLTSGFGRRRGGAGKFHKGIDLYTRIPKPVIAAGPGRVSFVGTKTGYGKVIYIDHGNRVTTRYAHLSAFAEGIHKGASITAGKTIGKTGKTGNATGIHLHYEVLVKDQQIDPLTHR